MGYVKDGWHKVGNVDAYTIDGRVQYVRSRETWARMYVYRFDKRLGCLTSDHPALSTLRSSDNYCFR